MNDNDVLKWYRQALDAGAWLTTEQQRELLNLAQRAVDAATYAHGYLQGCGQHTAARTIERLVRSVVWDGER